MNHENHPHYPEEYKIWEVEFFGKKFFATPDVLIPRLETEALVRRARKFLQENFTDKNQTFKWKILQKQYFQGDEDFLKGVYENVNDWEKSEINTENSSFSKIFDIGSGSGIIGTSLADLGKEIIFIDISPNALKIAQKNFLRNFWDFIKIPNHNSIKNFSKNPKTETIFTKNFQKIHFIESDLLANIDIKNIWKNEKILIVSNLPYIKNDDWENMSEDTIFEPKLALFGGEKTGFELYEKLFFEIQKLGLSGIAMIEFGFDQKEIAENFFGKIFPHWKVEFFPDFAGIERFAEIEF